MYTVSMDPLINGLTSPLTWAIFLGSCALTVTLGVILAYHWFRYAMNRGTAILACGIYATVSGFLLLGILAATIALNS